MSDTSLDFLEMVSNDGIGASEVASNASLDTSEMSSNTRSNSEPTPLFYSDQSEDVEFVHAGICSVVDAGSTEDGGNLLLMNRWSGSYTLGLREYVDGLESFDITSHDEDGAFEGNGWDSIGQYFISGTLKARQISFTKNYRDLDDGHKVSCKYDGMVNEEMDEISGRWGKPDSESSDGSSEPGDVVDSDRDNIYINTIVSEDDSDVEDTSNIESTHGCFVLKREHIEHLLFRPTENELTPNWPLGMWKWALKSVSMYHPNAHASKDGHPYAARPATTVYRARPPTRGGRSARLGRCSRVLGAKTHHSSQRCKILARLSILQSPPRNCL